MLQIPLVGMAKPESMRTTVLLPAVRLHTSQLGIKTLGTHGVALFNATSAYHFKYRDNEIENGFVADHRKQ